MNTIDIKIKVIQYFIEDYAILEVRHFNRELGHDYQQLIFYNKKKVLEKFSYEEKIYQYIVVVNMWQI